MKKLKSGKILIAEPFLGDANFERTVILLCEHNEEGSFGLILNQESNILLNDLLPEILYSDIKVGFGGPVQRNTLHFLHSAPNILSGGFEVLRGLYWGGDFEKMIECLNLGLFKPDQIKFFVGYSGWGAGQLEMELKRNSWILSSISADNIMNNSKEFWRDSLKKMGGDFKVMANYPIDPRLN